MFKEQNRIWWYLIGTVILMAALLWVARDYIIPVIMGQKKLDGGPFIYGKAPDFTINTQTDYLAKFTTSEGVVTFDLFEQSAPKNVNNFIFLTNQKYYDGTLFHRLIPDFMVQGGDRNTLDKDLTNDGRGNPGYFVSDEINWDYLGFSDAKRKVLTSKGYTTTADLPSHHLERYSLVMASSQSNTNGSQFFIVLADPNDPRLTDLDGMFTVIGRVQSGSDVLARIAALPVDNPNSESPRPKDNLTLQSVTIFTR